MGTMTEPEHEREAYHTWRMTSQDGARCEWVCGGCNAHRTTVDGKG